MGAVASIAVLCAWPPLLLPIVCVLLGLSRPTRSTLLTILAWNLACLVMFYVHSYVIGPVIVTAYTARFGDVQASYGRFAWVMTISAFLVIPLLPTFVSVRFYDALVRRPSDWRRVVTSSIAWELLLVPILIWSYVFNLHYKLSQLRWAILGPPENIYSFSNLLLPDLIAWLICTVPVGAAVLRLHDKTAGHSIGKLGLSLADPSRSTAVSTRRSKSA